MKLSMLVMASVLFGMVAWNSPVSGFEFHVSTSQEFQAALSSAGSNGGDDSIFLTPGTYVGNFKYQTSEANALTIKPEEGTAAGQVILDGNHLAYVLMLNAEGKAADFVLEGLVLQNGNSTNGGGLYLKTKGEVIIENCAFEKNTASSHGGGCYIVGATSVTFSNNNVTGNLSTEISGGGGVAISASSITFSNNIVTENHGCGVNISYASSVTFGNNNISGNYGFGLYISDTPLLIFNNNNVIGNYSAGIYYQNESYSNYSSVTFNNNNITGNSGGGVSFYYNLVDSSANFSNNNVSKNLNAGISFYSQNSNSSVYFYHNNITDNSMTGLSIRSSSVICSNNSVTKNSGGVYILSSDIIFSNNKVSENFTSGSWYGLTFGGIGISINGESSLNFINNTVSNNTTTGTCGGLSLKLPDTTGTLHIYNNIIWGNTSDGEGDDIYVEGYGSETNFYNNTYADMKAIWDNQGGNKTLDPLFFDPDNGDFHLKPNSPCIDTGHPGAPVLPSTDLEGNARNGIVDMGAYEHSTTALHPADTNQNWNLELSEFNAYNTAWRNSTDWTGLPSPVPMDYVTRAGYLNKSGGTYHNTGSNRPMCWTPGSR